MIKVYPIKIEAVDEEGEVLFTLKTEDAACCTVEIKQPLILSNGNLEEVLDAVRRGVKMLELE